MKHLTFFLIFALSIIKFQSSYAQNWTNISPPLAVTQQIHFHDVHFYNENLGFAAGFYGSLYRTNNGGSDWEKIDINTTLSLSSVYCISPDIIIVAGNGKAFKTIDGGTTWTQSNPGVYYGYGFTSLKFINDSIGFLTGYQGYLFKTTDQGESWTEIVLQNTPLGLSNIDYTPSGTLIVVGPGGRIHKSYDLGNTWIETYSSMSLYVSSIKRIDFIDENNGYFTALNKYFGITSDGGYTWDVTPLEDVTYHDLFFTDINHGLIIGGGVKETNDGGTSWNIITAPVHINCNGLQAMDFPNNNIGYFVGTGGTILKYEAITTDLLESTNYANSFNIFPNPFQNKLTLDLNELTNIEIVNVFGETIHSNQSKNGTIINTSSWGKGVYIVQTEYDGIIQKNKIIKY